jgi:hypothetical protein
LRGVEVRSLADDLVLDIGLQTNRTKGSNDNVTRWVPDLQEAVKQAQKERDAIWQKKAMPVPFKPENRLLLVNNQGEQIKPYAWQNAWKRFLKQAIDSEVITQDQVFGLHDMKRRGITDTKGGREAKLAGGGHKDVNMLDTYDFELPEVDAAGESFTESFTEAHP